MTEKEELVIIPGFGMALGNGVERARCMAHSYRSTIQRLEYFANQSKSKYARIQGEI
jgi:hypothetical protein